MDHLVSIRSSENDICFDRFAFRQPAIQPAKQTNDLETTVLG